MWLRKAAGLALLMMVAFPTLAQNPRVINSALKEGPSVSLDTNVTITLSMTREGETSPVDAVQLGENVTISAVIQPEAEDLGNTADVYLITASTTQGFLMRNQDGNFVTWDLRARSLEPTSTGITLEEGASVELFSGQLGVVDSFRIFLAYLVGEDRFYFTPVAMKFDIVDAGPSARAQAIELFEAEISPDIVQGACITCHRIGGTAQNLAQHHFVFTSDPEHLSRNFEEFEDLHGRVGRSLILSKVQGGSSHVGGNIVPNGSTNFNNLSEFLTLLDQADSE